MKKKIIAYALAISGLFGIYKGCNKLGSYIRENYIEDTYSTTTLNDSTVNTQIETILETIAESTKPSIIEETIVEPTEQEFEATFVPVFATTDLALFDENNNVNCMIEKYEKLYLTEISKDKVACVTTDGNYGYTNINLLETLPETYAEVDISDQKVYCYYQGELILTADCVTGIPTYGTTKGTNKGYTEINGKLYDSKLMGGAPSKIFISFNPDAEGFHDACWRSEFGGDIYLTNGSHGCVNMRLEDVKVLDKYLKAGDHVLVHK